MKLRHSIPLLLCVLLVVSTEPATAGLWDDPQNLKALPKDISPEQLRATMRSFATDTGSRCSTCHVYRDEADLSTYEFPSDDKVTKRRAREMIRLVAEINAFIDTNIRQRGAEKVKVECATCHRGVPRPQMLHDIIERTYRAEGIEAAITKYRELRGQYYGSYAYDFSPRALMIVAESLAMQDDHDSAIRFLDLDLEFNPQYARAYVLKARILADAGDREAARENLLRAIELEPDNPWNRQLLENLDTGG